MHRYNASLPEGMVAGVQREATELISAVLTGFQNATAKAPYDFGEGMRQVCWR